VAEIKKMNRRDAEGAEILEGKRGKKYRQAASGMGNALNLGDMTRPRTDIVVL
jgi:hypothetical protein